MFKTQTGEDKERDRSGATAVVCFVERCHGRIRDGLCLKQLTGHRERLERGQSDALDVMLAAFGQLVCALSFLRQCTHWLSATMICF